MKNKTRVKINNNKIRKGRKRKLLENSYNFSILLSQNIYSKYINWYLQKKKKKT